MLLNGFSNYFFCLFVSLLTSWIDDLLFKSKRLLIRNFVGTGIYCASPTVQEDKSFGPLKNF
jgi:hypothetical protein